MQKIRREILPQDIAMWVYMAILSTLIVIYRHNLPNWQSYLYFNFFISTLVLGAYWFLIAPNGWQKFFRHLYPLLIYVFLYEESGKLVLMIHPGYFDDLVQRLELALFGVHPTIWLERLYHPWTNEIFMLGYVSYYFLMPTLGISFYLKNRIRELDHFMLTISIGFYLSYLSFILIPVAGPHRSLADLEGKQLQGPIFTSMAKWLIAKYGIHGGCIPSSHVAVAFATLILALRHNRKLGYILSPFVFALCIGTFWGRFHYFTDMVTGLMVGSFAVWVTDRIMLARRAREKAGLYSITSSASLRKPGILLDDKEISG
jgi:membrane-associated phospholipid phosphatase